VNVNLQCSIVLENQYGLMSLNVLEIVDQPAGNPSVHRRQQSRIINTALRCAKGRFGYVESALSLLKLGP
jgi:hypothetical protein